MLPIKLLIGDVEAYELFNPSVLRPELKEELRLALELAENVLLPRVVFCFDSAAKNVYILHLFSYFQRGALRYNNQ